MEANGICVTSEASAPDVASTEGPVPDYVPALGICAFHDIAESEEEPDFVATTHQHRDTAARPLQYHLDALARFSDEKIRKSLLPTDEMQAVGEDDDAMDEEEEEVTTPVSPPPPSSPLHLRKMILSLRQQPP